MVKRFGQTYLGPTFPNTQSVNACIRFPASGRTKMNMTVGLHYKKRTQKMLRSNEELEKESEKEQIKESWKFTDRVVSKTPYFYRQM